MSEGPFVVSRGPVPAPLAQLRRHDEDLWRHISATYGEDPYHLMAAQQALAAALMGDVELAKFILRAPEGVWLADWPTLPRTDVAPKIEMLHNREPDSGCDYTFWVDGKRLDWGDPSPIAAIEDIDPGAGHQLSDWRSETFDTLESAGLSEDFKETVVREREAAEGNSYVEDDLEKGVKHIEISPCQKLGDGITVTTIEDAEFWSIYLHRGDDGALWQADYPTKEEAEFEGRRLAYIYQVPAHSTWTGFITGCPDCGNSLDAMLAVDDCPTNFQNHNPKEKS